MKLYHYRSISSALLEIENGTFHFASKEELNDPLEGFVRVFWQGDKMAWEGLFRHYIYSVARVLELYILKADDETLYHSTLVADVHCYKNNFFEKILLKLGEEFITDTDVQNLAGVYGDNCLKVSEKELQYIPTQEYLRPFYEELEAENRGGLQDMEKMQSVDLNYCLPGDILQKADKMSMAHSLEVRVPFLDKEVFDFAAKLPKEAKIAAGTTKYIFRKAVSQFIPQETDERKKLGFPIPIRVWLRQDDWYQMVKELFTSKEAEEFFHTDKLLLLLKEHKEKKADNSRKIWTVLTFLIWYDRFFATCSK